MRLIGALLLGFLLAGEIVHAQQWPFDYWHEGKLVLDTGDTLRGKIKYSIDQDIVQLDVKTVLQSFTARKVVYYEIFDATSGRYRQFYSVPYALKGEYKSPVFFELLTEGKLSLLSRETLETRTTTTGFYGYGTYSRVELVYKYFVLNDKGDLQPFSGKRPDLLDLMANREDEIKRYIRTYRLEAEQRHDLVRVFSYYNTLFKK